ncbi:MAG: hypothetical protein V3V08_12085 [Nannocystaceae bacterium]
MKMMHPLLTAIVGFACGVFIAPRPAQAWDLSTTHAALLDEAVVRSALHRNLMDASGLRRGLFSPLRIDAARLDDRQRQLFLHAQRRVHADSGARALGGPGSCPGADAPPQTRRFCVEKDLWELSAIGWLRLGLFAELTPSSRQRRHFLDATDPHAKAWRDDALSDARFRFRQTRSNGASFASFFSPTPGAGQAATVWAWLEDKEDALAPLRMYEHLAASHLAVTANERDHHLAVALVCAGALLHVLQDLAVPAHAHGDAAAFFSPLSDARGDRGLPFQEFVRIAYGRGNLPLGGHAAGVVTGAPLADSLRDHVFGDDRWEGPAAVARYRFLSESRLPAAQSLQADESAEEIAAFLLAQTELPAAAASGAALAPWPSPRGYVYDRHARALMAFVDSGDGEYQFYLDERSYRMQAEVLLPLAIQVSRSVLDLLFPPWPTLPGATATTGPPLAVSIPAAWTGARLHVAQESAEGQRAFATPVRLVSGQQPIPDGLERDRPTGGRTILIVEAKRAGGEPYLAERIVGQSPPVPPREDDRLRPGEAKPLVRSTRPE